MRFSELENEDALDLLCEVMEPGARIFADQAFVKACQGKEYMKAARICLKEHKKDIIHVLAALEGVNPSEYHATLPKMMKSLIDLFSDKELVQLFGLGDQKTESDASGEVTENTEETEEE